MAYLKKNAINQILFTMVDKTDFATIEASLASNFTVKRFGIVHGSATAASISTVASAVSKVGSGMYRLPLTAANCNFDLMTIRIAHASAATQILQYQMLTYDESDLYSFISDMSSDVKSAITVLQSIASDAHSAAAKSYSQVILAASELSDVHSALTLVQSELSDVHSQATLILSDTSNIYSALTGASLYSDIASAVWGHADGASIVARVLTIKSVVSDAHSAAAKAYSQVILGNSATSDVYSLLSDFYSDFGSRVPKAVATASRLLLAESVISDAHSAAVKGYSQAILLASAVSDLDSALTSRFSDIHSFMSTTGVGLNASTMSDLRSAMNVASVFLQASDYSDIISAIAAGPAATVTDSDISNIASAVWAASYSVLGAAASSFGSAFVVMTSRVSDAHSAAAQANSRTLVIQSTASDILSAATVNLSRVSDVYSLVSDVYSAMAVTATASDVASAVWGQKWDVHSTASTFGSAFAAWAENGVNLDASTMSDIRSAVTAATFTLSASDISDVASAVWANAIGSDVNSKVGKLASRITKEVANASQLLLVKSMASDAHSAAILAASHASDAVSGIALLASSLSDVDSALTSQYSNMLSLVGNTLGASDMYSKVIKLASRVTAPVATQSKLGVVESTVSDAHSAAILAASHASDAYSVALVVRSMVSDVDSGMTSLYSDLHSFMSTTGVGLNASTMSDLRSAMNAASVFIQASDYSDIISAIAAGPAAADATSIASAVWAHATASDATSKLGKLTSRVGKSVASYSKVSDLESNLLSLLVTTGINLNASVMSDLRSAVAAGPAATVTASDISDIASAVWAHATAASLVSRVSDVQSAMDSQYTKVYSAVQVAGLTVSAMSDIASQVWAHGTAASLISRVSDIQSALDSQFARSSDYLSNVLSQLTVVQSMASDAHSAAAQANSRALVVQSIASDAHSAAAKSYSQVILAASVLSDVQSALDSQYAKVMSAISDVESALDSQYADGQGLTASALSDIASTIDARLDVAFTDATSLNANGLKDRIRRMNWVLQNRMKINDASGDAVLYKDDNATAAYTVTAAVTDDGTSTLRKRLE